MGKTVKVYKVIITSRPVEQKFYLRVPKGVEINQEILENSSCFEDWWDEEKIGRISGGYEIESHSSRTLNT